MHLWNVVWSDVGDGFDFHRLQDASTLPALALSSRALASAAVRVDMAISVVVSTVSSWLEGHRVQRRRRRAWSSGPWRRWQRDQGEEWSAFHGCSGSRVGLLSKLKSVVLGSAAFRPVVCRICLRVLNPSIKAVAGTGDGIVFAHGAGLLNDLADLPGATADQWQVWVMVMVARSPWSGSSHPPPLLRTRSFIKGEWRRWRWRPPGRCPRSRPHPPEASSAAVDPSPP